MESKETWAFRIWVEYDAYVNDSVNIGWRGKREAWLWLFAGYKGGFKEGDVNVWGTGKQTYRGL